MLTVAETELFSRLVTDYFSALKLWCPKPKNDAKRRSSNYHCNLLTANFLLSTQHFCIIPAHILKELKEALDNEQE